MVDLRKPEVDNFWGKVCIHTDVFRFEVPMHEPHRVDVLQTTEKLGQYFSANALTEWITIHLVVETCRVPVNHPIRNQVKQDVREGSKYIWIDFLKC